MITFTRLLEMAKALNSGGCLENSFCNIIPIEE